MTKKKELPYSELDIIMQASSDVTKQINDLAKQIVEKYDGGMALNTAITAAKEYYMLGFLSMQIDPEIRKKAEATLKEYHKERDARLKKAEK